MRPMILPIAFTLIFLSSCTGETPSAPDTDTSFWQQTGLTNTIVFALAINSSGDIFAGTRGDGVFRSTNNGDSWSAINTGVTNTVVFALAINSSGDIFAGTGGGVFRHVGSTTAQ